MKPRLSTSNQLETKRKTGFNQTIGIFLIIACILFGAIITMGCMNSFPGANNTPVARPDPETGLVYWISAVNEKNVPRLYELSPDFIKKNITENDFILANQGNPLLKPGFKFVNYSIENKTLNGDNATIKTVLEASFGTSNGNSTQVTPLFFNFNLTYQDNEWKIWDVPF